MSTHREARSSATAADSRAVVAIFGVLVAATACGGDDVTLADAALADGAAPDGPVADGAPVDAPAVDGGPPRENEVVGSVAGVMVDAQSAIVQVNMLPTGVYAQFSVQEWIATCDDARRRENASQINFTLRIEDGTLDDILPGTYMVGAVAQDLMLFVLSGALGRYGPACDLGAGFVPIDAGTMTLTEVDASFIAGTFDFHFESGDTATGRFRADRCAVTSPLPSDCAM